MESGVSVRVHFSGLPWILAGSFTLVMCTGHQQVQMTNDTMYYKMLSPLFMLCLFFFNTLEFGFQNLMFWIAVIF